MADKTVFAQKIQNVATSLAQAVNDAADIETIYFDRGYNSGGSDPIIDADVSGRGITAANIASFITLAQQLANFANNAAVTQADYDATLNILRTDI